MKITRFLACVNLVLMSGVWIWATVRYAKEDHLFQVTCFCENPHFICSCTDEEQHELLQTRLILFVLMCFTTVAEILMSILLIRTVCCFEINPDLRSQLVLLFWGLYHSFLSIVLCVEGLVMTGKFGTVLLNMEFLMVITWKLAIGWCILYKFFPSLRMGRYSRLIEEVKDSNN